MEETHWIRLLEWTALTDQELTDLIDAAQTEHARRQRAVARPSAGTRQKRLLQPGVLAEPGR